LRVIATVHQFVPDYSSGTEVLTHACAKELQLRGHDVTVLAGYPARVPLDDDRRFNQYVYDGLTVHRFMHAHVPLAGQTNVVEAEYNSWISASYFRRLISEIRPDVVHFFHLSRLSGSLIDVCIEHGIRMIATPTDFWFICPTCQLRLPDNTMCQGPRWLGANCVKHVTSQTQRGTMAKIVANLPEPILAAGILGLRSGLYRSWPPGTHVRALAGRGPFLISRLNRVDRILAPTNLMADLLKRNGVDPDRIEICRYGINLPKQCERRVPRSSREALRVGFIGTIFEHKGVHVLIEAMARIARVDVQLKIYGKLGEFPDYSRKVQAMAAGDSRIRFMGTFPNSEIGKVFAELDVLVVPSIWYENTPLVIYSAKAFACPVIASDLGGMSEAIDDGVDGLLFPVSNAAILAETIEKLAQNNTLLQRLSAAAKPPRSTAHYVDEIERAYHAAPAPRADLSAEVPATGSP
jgi:glycosyltransferase involved in cell wall biosynthesis